MDRLTPEVVDAVRAGLKGKRLEKFDASVAVINAALGRGGWLPGESRSATTGFGSGCGIKWNLNYFHDDQHSHNFALMMCCNYGSNPRGEINEAAYDALFSAVNVSRKTGKETPVTKGFTREFVKAWVAICAEAREAVGMLNESRPAPVITKIGLSPKVTATLKEMSLDIDLPSIKMAEIKYREVQAKNKKGETVTIKVPYVAWTPGTKFGRSRFHQGCQACGKHIPSGMYVPIEADDLKSGDHCGFWIGCDCARNIFGVKDIGVEKTA